MGNSSEGLLPPLSSESLSPYFEELLPVLHPRDSSRASRAAASISQGISES